MKNWTRIKEQYNGGFTEMYLDLYKHQGTFMIKGTSYHYNAGAENMLCEVVIPNTIQRTEDILKFIIDNNEHYLWAKITPEEIRSNERLRAFIEENK